MITSNVAVAGIVSKHIKDYVTGGLDGGVSADFPESQTQRGDYEIMQYTGCKDKFGTEIYEGDLVFVEQGKYFDQYLGQVDFQWGRFWVVRHNGYGGNGYSLEALLNGDLHQTARIAVKGHIYMTPNVNP